MSKLITIDIDKAIKFYNDKDPIEKFTRAKLNAQLENPITKQTLLNWKKGKVPMGFHVVFEIAAITGCQPDSIITIKDGKRNI